ncbi:MAG: 23S rRNA (uracil(1939)-C(5))-methyltransferase RlmD [Bacillota bacterium]
MKKELPVTAGQEVELVIDGVSHSGDGVGRYNGFTVFVTRSIPGETVRARITEIKKNFAEADLLEVVQPSPRRVAPGCPVFNECGGSHLQHMGYDLQLEVKTRQVADALKRIGKLRNLPVHPAIGMETPWHYRNKAQFQVTRVDGKIKMGFFEEESHRVVPTTDCLLLDRQIGDVAVMTEKLLNKYNLTVYDRANQTGLLRHVVIRKGWHTGKVMVVLVTGPEKFPEQYLLAREFTAKTPYIVSVVRNINDNAKGPVFGKDSVLLAGRETIPEQIGNLKFLISPTSFFQVNPRQVTVLYDKVMEYAALTGQETVLDVYCGIGTITLFLARRAAHAFGLEINREAVIDAAANARLNGISNVEFISGKAEERLPKLIKQGIRPDVVVVDPPRKGVDKRALQAITDMEPQRIVYVSCDPASLARDLEFLSHRNYRTVEVQPVDMFPQTHHVECVIGIQRVKSTK